jgi:hypothetical protein
MVDRAGVPVLTFTSRRSDFICERQNQGTLASLCLACGFEFDIRNMILESTDANAEFTT